MALSDEDTKKVAGLARLKMDSAAIADMTPKLSKIIGFVEQLAQVNTDDVEPLANVVDITLHLREDKVTDGGYADLVLANAPETTQGYFVVGKVVE